MDIIDRLRGKVRVPITDGLGPVTEGGSPNFFERSFPTSILANEAADEIERLRAALTGDCGGGDLSALKTDADNAYCRYIDQIDKNCRGADYKLENAQFSKSDLSAHIQAYELLGFHRGIHHALKTLTADNAKRGE